MELFKIYVPMKFGSDFNGSDLGALSIKNRFINDNDIQIKVQGNPTYTSNLKNLDIVIEMSKKLSKIVEKTILLNKFPLIIGGDHSVSLGSLSAIGSQHNNIGVFWIDAHADMNTPDTTPTGNIHGMILASLQGLGNNLLTKIHSEKIKVKTENIVLFGTRDIDEGEGVLIDQLNVKNISYEKLKINYEKNVEESIKYMKSKTMEVHISLDIDSLNPMIAPGVSTPVSGGLDTKQLYYFLQNIFDNFNVVSMDIVEYNSLNDKGEATLKIIIDIIDFIEKKIRNKKNSNQ